MFEEILIFVQSTFRIKKIIPIFLLSLILLGSIGYLPVYYFTRVELREAMRENIQNGKLDHHISVLTISASSKNAITWMEDDEFEYKGNRYDVVKHESRAGMDFYYVIHDKKEQSLTAVFSDHVKGQSENKTSSKASIAIKLMMQLYSPVSDLFISTGNGTKILYPSVACGDVLSPAHSITTPPPEA